MEVAADLLLHLPQMGDVGVDLDLEQVAVGLEAVERAVEEVPAIGRAVDGSGLGEVEEGFWDMRREDGLARGSVGFGRETEGEVGGPPWRLRGRAPRGYSPAEGRRARGCASR